MNKKLIIPLAAGFVVIIAAVVVGILLFTSNDSSTKSRNIVIDSIEGSNIRLLKSGTDIDNTENLENNDGYAARIGTKLSAGYRLSTGEDSYVCLKMDDNSTIKLDVFTEIEVSKASSKELEITVINGSISVDAGKQKDGHKTAVKAGNSTMGLRGTLFTVVYIDGKNQVFLLEGELEITTPDNTYSLTSLQVLEVTPEGTSSVRELDLEELDIFTLELIREKIDFLIENEIFTPQQIERVDNLLNELLRQASDNNSSEQNGNNSENAPNAPADNNEVNEVNEDNAENAPEEADGATSAPAVTTARATTTVPVTTAAPATSAAPPVITNAPTTKTMPQTTTVPPPTTGVSETVTTDDNTTTPPETTPFITTTTTPVLSTTIPTATTTPAITTTPAATSTPASSTTPPDLEPPTGTISIKTNNFATFVGSLNFSMFFKNSVNVTITSPDADVIEYYLSDTALPSTANWETLSWTAYSGTAFTIPANYKGMVYARLTKTVNGKSTVISSNGLAVFTDIDDNTLSAEFYKGSGSGMAVEINMNGNTVNRITNGTVTLQRGIDYTVSGNEILFGEEYMESLATGEYTLTVYYNPLGEIAAVAPGNDTIGATVIELSVSYSDRASVSTLNELKSAIAAAPENGALFTIEVIGNITLDDEIIIDAGKNIIMTSGAARTIKAAAGSRLFTVAGGLTLRNNITLEGTGFVNNNGGGVYVYSGGAFTMDGGTITGNTAIYGGGVYVGGGGMFIMSGGVISNNNASTDMSGEGGGVYVDSYGTFELSGGTISQNEAYYGGGVSVQPNGEFTISGGGRIVNNEAISWGGGLYNYGTSNVYGGEISGNSALLGLQVFVGFLGIFNDPYYMFIGMPDIFFEL